MFSSSRFDYGHGAVRRHRPQGVRVDLDEGVSGVNRQGACALERRGHLAERLEVVEKLPVQPAAVNLERRAEVTPADDAEVQFVNAQLRELVGYRMDEGGERGPVCPVTAHVDPVHSLDVLSRTFLSQYLLEPRACRPGSYRRPASDL